MDKELREIKLGEVEVYFSYSQPPQQNYFVLSEEIQGFGVFCEDKKCKKECSQGDCSGKLKVETSELVLGKGTVRALKFSYEGEGRLWFWFGPAMREIFSLETKILLEVLAKDNISGYMIITELVVSETEEVLGSYNITENLRCRNQWNVVEIPLGVGGFNIDWFKLAKPGTFTLAVKILPLENEKEPKGSLYFRSLIIK
ncbi:MAG: hypothetical protein NC818_02765 [Candidatus Omnitrophica bacterium]|nr:hypothetical protein [Candidatus Omnitrophota bacterium]